MSNGDNGKEIKQEQKEAFIKIWVKGEQVGYETNVSNTIIGYGLCEWGKKAVDIHLMQLAQKSKPKIRLPFGR